MPNDVSKIVVNSAKGTGGWLWAPPGTALPTSLTAALNAAFQSLGLLSDANIEETIGSSTTLIRDINGNPVRTVTSEHDVTYSFEALETNEIVLKLKHGTANVTRVDGSPTVGEQLDWKITGDALPTQPHVIELTDGVKTFRGVLPKAQVYELGSSTMGASEARRHPFGVRCYPDASGVKAYWYSNDNVLVP